MSLLDEIKRYLPRFLTNQSESELHRTLLDEIKRYLPEYLSTKSQSELLQALKAHVDGAVGEYYCERLRADAYLHQGDGFADLLFADLPSRRIDLVKAVIVSNTCDISPDNNRTVPPRLLYCPMIRLKALERLYLDTGKPAESVASTIESIKKQKNTSYFYFPEGAALGEDYVALLDRVTNCSLDSIPQEAIVERRLFSLSNFGFYLFLFKLSVHFTRIGEAIDRSEVGEWDQSAEPTFAG